MINMDAVKIDRDTLIYYTKEYKFYLRFILKYTDGESVYTFIIHDINTGANIFYNSHTKQFKGIYTQLLDIYEDLILLPRHLIGETRC